VLVQPCVDPDISSAHLLFSKLLDFLDGSWSPVLEADSVKPFMQVDCILSGHDLAHRGALLLAFWRHLDDYNFINGSF
jgi:hypothetical protein